MAPQILIRIHAKAVDFAQLVIETNSGAGLRSDCVLQLQPRLRRPADPRCDGKVTTHKEDRSRFQVKEDIFEQQSPAPCAREEAIHEGARGRVVGISFVVKANQETGIEDNHRPSP
jgi:hypothetical protein